LFFCFVLREEQFNYFGGFGKGEIKEGFHLDEMQSHFPADGLVAVDVGHVLDIRFAFHVLERRRRDHHHPQIATCWVH
jgi:hypothetical protein